MLLLFSLTAIVQALPYHKLFTLLIAGSTTGSTHVESQLKEIKEQQLKESKEQKENKDPGQEKEKFAKNRYSYGQSKERLEADQAVFKVYKGVKCFDFSKDKNIIVTGGNLTFLVKDLISIKKMDTSQSKAHF